MGYSYSVDLDVKLREASPGIERLLVLFVKAWDDHLDVLQSLDDIGLSHCARPLERSLSEGDQGLRDEGYDMQHGPRGEKWTGLDRWVSKWTWKWRNRGQHTLIPVSMAFYRFIEPPNTDRE